MPRIDILSEAELDEIVADRARLLDFLQLPVDTECLASQVTWSLNKARVTIKALDVYYLTGGYDLGKDFAYMTDNEFGGKFPQPSASAVRQTGGHERAIRALIGALHADSKKLHAMRRRGNVLDSRHEEKFVYKIIRSLEAETSRILANQRGEHVGCALRQRPRTVSGTSFTSQCGYTAAVAAQKMVSVAIDLLLPKRNLACHRPDRSYWTAQHSQCS